MNPRPEYLKAVEECEKRLSGICEVEGLDDAGVVTALLRTAISIHLKQTDDMTPEEREDVFGEPGEVNYFLGIVANNYVAAQMIHHARKEGH